MAGYEPIAGARRPYPYVATGMRETIIDRKCSRCGSFFRIRMISRMVMCRSCWESMEGNEWIRHWRRWPPMMASIGWHATDAVRESAQNRLIRQAHAT